MKNHKLGILKVRDNFQSCREIESNGMRKMNVQKLEFCREIGNDEEIEF